MDLTLFLVCFFTFIIHFTETIIYGMRLSGIKTRQLSIALSFVTTSLIISRLSNMFQAPFLGKMIDLNILEQTSSTLALTNDTPLVISFRIIIFSGFLGSLSGAFFTPTTVIIFSKAIHQFHNHGSIIKVLLSALKPKSICSFFSLFRPPSLSWLKNFSLNNIPRTFLFLNIIVTAIYTIGVLCSLLAGAYLPHFRSTANQLSGLVNGVATILLTLFVDPSGARITDQVFHKKRPVNDLISVVICLQIGRLLGILILAQLFLIPFTRYIIVVTRFLSKL